MNSAKAQIESLAAEITPERYSKLLRALANRTRKICVVLEDVFQSHNAAAVLRNCDAFGIQDIWFIENKYKVKISDNVDMGVSKWQTIHKFTSSSAIFCRSGMPKPKVPQPFESENSRNALLEIKKRGYALVASVIDSSAVSLDSIPVDRPLALMIGTELSGLSPTALELADFKFTVPMLGFAQSFNLSVFSALCLSNLCRRMRELGDSWKLSEQEREDILLSWLSKA